MCFILTAIKLQENEPVKNAIYNVLKNEQDDNPHGTGALCFSPDKKPVIKRDMFLSGIEIKQDLDNFDVINYHFRMATIGEKNIKNVHFWKHGNWAFCHNGGIGDMGTFKESDSNIFFKQLYDKGYCQKNNNLKCAKIKEHTNKSNFWGRFLIINLVTKNIYFFGDFKCYLVGKSYLVLTSSNASFENKLEIMGLTFDDNAQEIEVIESEIDGVFVLRYETNKFEQIFETFKEIPKSVYGYGNETGSRPRQNSSEHMHVSIANKGKEETSNLNRNEVLASKLLEKKEKKEKKRSPESYIREFENRLKKIVAQYPIIEEDIGNEYALGQINEYGRTDTEEYLWLLWKLPDGIPMPSVKNN